MQFDGEEGLDAGIEVEWFTGPAGSDGAGVGMLEAVCGSELSGSGLVMMLGLLSAAKGEVDVSGEIRIIDPRVTALPIGFGEDPALPVAGDGDTTLMDYGVVPLTQQDQIGDVRVVAPSWVAA